MRPARVAKEKAKASIDELIGTLLDHYHTVPGDIRPKSSLAHPVHGLPSTILLAHCIRTMQVVMLQIKRTPYLAVSLSTVPCHAVPRPRPVPYHAHYRLCAAEYVT